MNPQVKVELRVYKGVRRTPLLQKKVVIVAETATLNMYKTDISLIAGKEHIGGGCTSSTLVHPCTPLTDMA
jgi:hypothetical protein